MFQEAENSVVSKLAKNALFLTSWAFYSRKILFLYHLVLGAEIRTSRLGGTVFFN